jgi:general secretion pathway protein J
MKRFAEHGFTRLRRSAEHGFTRLRRSAEHGFTLVEMMVALFIFAMVAASGVALLAFSVRAQAAAQGQLDRIAAERRMLALLTTDLAQAVPRAARDRDGERMRAFTGNDGTMPGLVMRYVRIGRSNPENLQRPGVERIELVFGKGRLERRAYAMADGSASTIAITLADRLASIRVRYRDRDGWRDRWEPQRPDAMPRALEITLTPQGRPALLAAFIVGTRYP